jgi:hypothetical protein
LDRRLHKPTQAKIKRIRSNRRIHQIGNEENRNIREDQAKTAVEVIVKFLKEKLPEPIASQLDLLIEGGDITEGLSKGLGGLGDLLGRKK